MSTKVAVISSRAFKERLTKLAQQITDIELDFYIYKHPAQTPTLLKSVKPCDVLFITGTLPYLYSKPMLENWPIPWTYLKQDEFAVSNTLPIMPFPYIVYPSMSWTVALLKMYYSILIINMQLPSFMK